jgi:hypothetical protein
MKQILVLSILIFQILSGFAQQNLSENAKIALKSGDSQKLSRLCAASLEFGLDGDAEAMSSRKVAENLAGFFRQNPPADALIQFQGKGKDGRKFLVCKYKSSKGSDFRISFYWKEKAPEQFEAIDITKD